MTLNTKAPSIYIGHGAPFNAIWTTQYHQNIADFARNYDKPDSIVVVSAHWEKHRPMEITSSQLPGIIYDYYGFPKEMYELEYPSLGDPKLANRIANKLTDIGFNTSLNPKQGLDHGAWIPLKIMYPEADIPIIQLSIPIPRSPEELYKIGKTLLKFREDNIMMLGSGNLTHNLPHVFQQIRSGKFDMNSWADQATETWAKESDQWLQEKLSDRNITSLLNASSELPNFNVAAPTTEHFDPLYFVLGTMNDNEGIAYIHEGFEAGSISMRTFVTEV